MSHPFKPEYMMEGEMSSTKVDANLDGTSQTEIQQESKAEKTLINSRQGTIIRTCESFAGECQTNEAETNPDGDLETIRAEIKITIEDKERLSFLKILRMAMTHRMEIFAQEVSIVGLSYLVKPSSYKVGSIIRKVMWTMLLLFGTSFMVFQIYDRISYYQSYPTVVKYRVAYNRSLRFPTVTICSEILASKKSLISMGD